LASQESQLIAAGCGKVFAEKVTGARSDRAELAIVTRLDRLARSTRDLLNILHHLAEKGAKFRSLADAWCDTSTPQGELLVTVLAGFATFERHSSVLAPMTATSAPKPAASNSADRASLTQTSAAKRCNGSPMATRWSMWPARSASIRPRSAAGRPARPGGPEASCDSPGLLRGLIEDINASAQRDMPWRGLMNKGVRQVDLPALLHQRTQRIDDSVALVERAALARGVQNAAEFFQLFILSVF
jgi:Resolvase, N terminal domain